MRLDYPKKLFNSAKIWGWLSLVFIFLSIASVVACAWLGTKLEKNMAYYFVTDSNTFLAFGTGISTFMFFKNIKIKYSRFINTVAASAFGVLMIHANGDVMRQWLWKDTLKNTQAYSSPLLIVHAIGSVLAIYIICTLIDYLRIKFIEKPFFILWDKKWGKISSKYKTTEKRLCQKFNINND